MSFSEEKFQRLQKAIKWSQDHLAIVRKKRVEAVRLFVGHHYHEDGTPKREPVNFLKLAVGIYLRALAARAPRALISVSAPALKPMAANLELAVNQIPAEIHLEDALRRIVMEAMFSPFGVAKVGLHEVGEILGHSYGEPFVDVITADDYFLDMSAKRMEQVQFEGNDYWLSREEILDSGWLDKKGRKALGSKDEADEETTIGEHGEERAESISTASTPQAYMKRKHLRDVWIPHEGLLITYTVQSKKILKEVELDGPERGPYHKLSFTDVPGNLLALPPVSVWRDLHELGNALYRKLSRQADKQKSVLGFGGNAADDEVLNFKNAADGDGIRYNGPDPQLLTAGGVSQNTLAFFMQSRDLASYFGGNWDALGGLGPQAETLGQDKLLTEAASAQLRDMASRTVAFSRELFRSLAYYEWHDPVKTRTLKKPYPGGTLNVPWVPEIRQGDFSVYDLDIDVYSLLDDTPSLKLQRLGYIWQTYIVPMLPEIRAQGGELDVRGILALIAKCADFQELADLISFVDAPPGQQEGQQGMPQETTRRYERVSRPGATPRGKSDVLQRVLMGDRPQKAEADVLG